MLTKLIVLVSAASLALAAHEALPPVPGKVRALLVDPSHQDRPTVTDASIESMHERLKTFTGHLDINITRMSDNWQYRESWKPTEEHVMGLYPKAENVKTELNRLVGESVSGDTLLFVYGGHGGSEIHPANLATTKQHSRQYLVCTNMQKDGGGRIWDCDLNDIVNRAKPGVKVLLIIMSCHSGYMARLPYRYDSKNAPRIVRPDYDKLQANGADLSKDDFHRFNARYNAWSAEARWYIPAVYPSITRDSSDKSVRVDKALFSIPSQLPNIHADELKKKPMIICFSAAEVDQIARVDVGKKPIFQGFGSHSVFTIRMMKYIFGDDESPFQHRKRNDLKPIGKQFYMTQDSIKIQSQNHKPVMTSNVRFDVSKFTVWDFMTRRVEQDPNGVYCMYKYKTDTKCWDWVDLRAPTDQIGVPERDIPDV